MTLRNSIICDNRQEESILTAMAYDKLETRMGGHEIMSYTSITRWLFVLSPSVLLFLSAPGCIATRGWVTEQLNPLGNRVSTVETRLGQADTKVDNALDRLDNLRLERRFVLNLKEGVNFGFDKAVLTAEARKAIDGFLSGLKDGNDATFVITGHTDSSGSEGDNQELGQKRANSVARYLITHKGIDPLRVMSVSYGERAPLVDNASLQGRRKNRRIEVRVYKEVIHSASPKLQLDLGGMSN
jgi:outer membrane protein OmpA-like peptidoglycan-associated protein